MKFTSIIAPILILFMAFELSSIRDARGEVRKLNAVQNLSERDMLALSALVQAYSDRETEESTDKSIVDELNDLYSSMGREPFLQALKNIALEHAAKGGDEFYTSLFIVTSYLSMDELDSALEWIGEAQTTYDLVIAENRMRKKANLYSRGGFGEFVAVAIFQKSESMMEQIYHPLCLQEARAFNDKFFKSRLKTYFKYSNDVLKDVSWQDYSPSLLGKEPTYPVKPTHNLVLTYVSRKAGHGGGTVHIPAAYQDDRWYLVFPVPDYNISSIK